MINLIIPGVSSEHSLAAELMVATVQKYLKVICTQHHGLFVTFYKSACLSLSLSAHAF